MDRTIKTEIIFDFIKDNNISKTTFSRMTRSSILTINKILNTGKITTLKPLIRIATILKMKTFELLDLKHKSYN